MARHLMPEERMRRARYVRLHVIVALFTLMALIAVNALTSSAYPWWLWVLMAWMPIVAAHTAWSMGLFERNQVDRNKEGS
jgi:fatty acid desaturase